MPDTAEWLMLMLLNLKVTRTETLVWGMLGGEGVPVASNQDISSAWLHALSVLTVAPDDLRGIRPL